MPAESSSEVAATVRPTRGAARRAQTRADLVAAAQALIAEDRTEVSIEEITKRADVGLGSFYNHFSDKAALWAAALSVALDAHGARLAAISADLPDPAEVVCVGIRLTGRMIRQNPQVASVLLHTQVSKLVADGGLVMRLRQDIEVAAAAGRFALPAIEVGVAMAVGSVIGLLDVLVQHPTQVADELVDDLTERLLLAFGLDPAEALRLVTMPLPAADR